MSLEAISPQQDPSCATWKTHAPCSLQCTAYAVLPVSTPKIVLWGSQRSGTALPCANIMCNLTIKVQSLDDRER